MLQPIVSWGNFFSEGHSQRRTDSKRAWSKMSSLASLQSSSLMFILAMTMPHLGSTFLHSSPSMGQQIGRGPLAHSPLRSMISHAPLRTARQAASKLCCQQMNENQGVDTASLKSPSKYQLYPQRWTQLIILSALALLSDWACFATAGGPNTWVSQV